MLINTQVSEEIFTSLNLNNRFDNIFQEVKTEFDAKIDEVKLFISKRETHTLNPDELSSEIILTEFKKGVFEYFAILTIQNLFLNPNQQKSLEQGILELLTIESVKETIASDIMIDSICTSIKAMPEDNATALSNVVKTSTIFAIKVKFLEKHPFKNLYSKNSN